MNGNITKTAVAGIAQARTLVSGIKKDLYPIRSQYLINDAKLIWQKFFEKRIAQQDYPWATWKVVQNYSELVVMPDRSNPYMFIGEFLVTGKKEQIGAGHKVIECKMTVGLWNESHTGGVSLHEAMQSQILYIFLTNQILYGLRFDATIEKSYEDYNLLDYGIRRIVIQGPTAFEIDKDSEFKSGFDLFFTIKLR